MARERACRGSRIAGGVEAMDASKTKANCKSSYRIVQHLGIYDGPRATPGEDVRDVPRREAGEVAIDSSE